MDDAATKFFKHIAANPTRTPLLTELPPGYSNWQTEADLEREIERLRKYIASCEFDMQEYGGFSDRDIAQRRSSHLEPGDMTETD